MARQPYSATGFVTMTDGGWRIEVDQVSRPVLENGTRVRLLYWSDTPTGDPTELEAISNAQQLDLSIVAEGLSAEGALVDERTEFLGRLGFHQNS